jgi:hypothetical protein
MWFAKTAARPSCRSSGVTRGSRASTRFKKTLTRDRVVPTIVASVSCEIVSTT